MRKSLLVMFLILLTFLHSFVIQDFLFVFYASSFCLDNIFFDLDKKFCPKLKNCYFLGKRIENGFLVVEKKLSIAKKSFSIHFTSKYVLCFSLGQKLFCLGEKIFYPGQKNFVWVDG